jgi:hypothetical protein
MAVPRQITAEFLGLSTTGQDAARELASLSLASGTVDQSRLSAVLSLAQREGVTTFQYLRVRSLMEAGVLTEMGGCSAAEDLL